jgi:hypothetical protein
MRLTSALACGEHCIEPRAALIVRSPKPPHLRKLALREKRALDASDQVSNGRFGRQFVFQFVALSGKFERSFRPSEVRVKKRAENAVLVDPLVKNSKNRVPCLYLKGEK